MNHTIKHGRYTLRIHRIDPICSKTAKRIEKRIQLNPPTRPIWADLWR